MRKATLFIIGTAISLSGCAITQSVKPVNTADISEVCIVQNPPVRPGFLQTYTQVLGMKGYKVTQLPPGSPASACPVVSTYMGLWSWDLALYLSFAEITVFRGGLEEGKAVYDSRSGGANLNKFVKGEEKITELVNALFPGSAKK
jgi:hypothetical protein